MDEILGYQFEDVDFHHLEAICKDLHGNGSALSSDKRRDMANLMSLVLSRAIPVME